MKAGLVAALGRRQALRSAGVALRGDLLLASVHGEEDGGLGTYATPAAGWRPTPASSPSRPISTSSRPTPGALTFRPPVRGRATHASRRTEGVSAIEKFWPVWQALRQLEADATPTVDPLIDALGPRLSPLDRHVHAGDWASSVPDLLIAEGRIGRGARRDRSRHARAAFEAAVATACPPDPWLRHHPVEVEWWGGQFASGRLPADSDLVGGSTAAHRRRRSRQWRQDVWARARTAATCAC